MEEFKELKDIVEIYRFGKMIRIRDKQTGEFYKLGAFAKKLNMSYEAMHYKLNGKSKPYIPKKKKVVQDV